MGISCIHIVYLLYIYQPIICEPTLPKLVQQKASESEYEPINIAKEEKKRHHKLPLSKELPELQKPEYEEESEDEVQDNNKINEDDDDGREMAKKRVYILVLFIQFKKQHITFQYDGKNPPKNRSATSISPDNLSKSTVSRRKTSYNKNMNQSSVLYGKKTVDFLTAGKEHESPFRPIFKVSMYQMIKDIYIF